MNPDLVRQHKTGLLIFVLYSFYAVGAIGHILDRTYPYMIVLTPFVLLVFGIAVLINTTGYNPKFLLWCLAAYLFTFSIEVLGVHTGKIFGQYHYGDTLGIKLLGVPLVIGFNWVIVVLGAIALAKKISRNTFCSSLLAALFTVGFDIPLEIVAVNLDYWHWPGGFVPLQNYIAWFVVALIVALSFDYLKLQTKSRAIIHYFLIQFIFFFVIDILIFANLI